MNKELKQLNNKQLPKLTKKQANFVSELLGDKKISATEAASRTYAVKNRQVAEVIAHENLRKPQVLAHLEANSERAERKIVELMSSAKKEEVQIQAAKDILDRVHGKATQRIEQSTTGVTLTIDLTSALNSDS